MLRKKSVVRQYRVGAVVAPLALVLSMSISHQAMAACTPAAGALTTNANVLCQGSTTSVYWGSTTSLTPVNGVTITNTGNFSVDNQSNANAQAVNLLGSRTSFINESGAILSISGYDTTSAARTVRGVQSSVPGYVAPSPLVGTEFENVLVRNYGTIIATIGDSTHTGVGTAQAIYAGEEIESMKVENHGSITAVRGTAITTTAPAPNLVSDGAGGYKPASSGGVNQVQAAAGGGANANVGRVSGIESDDDVEDFQIHNYSGGTITGNGAYAYGIYLRAPGSTITNDFGATISSVGGGVGHVAINANFTGETTLNNAGTVTGDIQFVDANGLKIQALREEPTKYQLFDGTTNTPDAGKTFLVLDQLGVRDSVINNYKTGVITGNIYLGTGEHEIVNEGKINGSITVDQRNVPGGTNTTWSTTLHGEREFTFENDGTLAHDLTVFTQDDDGEITLRPHIYGGGADSANDAPDADASAYIGGTLSVRDQTNATTLKKVVEVNPVIDSLVRTGEWYTVAAHVDDTAGNVDDVEVESGFIVEWEAKKNASNAFVIGATVKNASAITGLSNPGITTVNALMQGGSDETEELGGAFQMLDEADARKAGEQLKPETNFATQQAAFTLNTLTGGYIDNRLNGVGATAPSTAGFAAPSGLGMSQTASAAPAGRMSLGLGSDDGRMNIGAYDGRMDAGIYDDDVDLRQRGYTSALWGQAFGAGLDQGKRSNVDGYQTHIYGALAGVDNWISSNTRLGFAGGYGNTSIDGSGDTQKNTTDIDSYLGVVYGAVKGEGWYLSTRAGYAWHDYTTKRIVSVPVSDVATGSHSGSQYSAAAEVGTPFQLYGGSTLTPVASVTWSQLDQDAYGEASKNGVGLSIASQENTSLASGLGVKTLIPIAQSTLLEGRAIWYHEFEDTNQQVTAAFGGGPSFLASGPSVGRDTAAVGLGLFAYAEAGVSFQLNYDALLRQDFIGHTGSGRVKVEF